MSDRITWRRVEELHRAIEDVDPRKLMQSGVSAIVVDGDPETDEVLIDLSVPPESRRFSVSWAPAAVANALRQLQDRYEHFHDPLEAGDTNIGRWLSEDTLAIAIDALRPIVEAQAEEADDV